MSRRVIVPFNLPCCPDEPRCALCGPPRDPPALDYILALVHRTREDKGAEGLVAAFYGGAPPTDAMLEAAGLPAQVRVRPDLLDRETAMRLRQAGVTRVELDALTFDDRVLMRAGRRYRGALVEEMCEGLAELGFEVGIVLAPGLHGHSHEGCILDAQRAARLVDTARLHPVLVLDGSGLRELHMRQLYRPLTLGEAVGTCREMADILEEAGVVLLRIGQQAVPDGLGRAVAGPRHTSLRQLVEAARTLDTLQALLGSQHLPERVAIRCSPKDETRARGPLNDHIRVLRADHGLDELQIVRDPALERGHFRVEELEQV